MRAGVLGAMAAVMVVAGCAGVRDSRLNPMNWFGRSQATTAVTAGAAVPVRDGGRVPVAQVTEMFVEPATGGAIIRATGVPPTQGWYRAELIEEPAENPEELVFRFVLRQPEMAGVGTPHSREVTVATFVTNHRLENIRTVTVTGAQNARNTRRR